MRKILALLGMLLATAASAQTGTYQTKPNMQSEINTQLPDNTTGAITPAILRGVLSDMLASWQQQGLVNAQVGTNYTVVVGDNGKMLTLNNGAAVSVNVPQATGSFASFDFIAVNLGAGVATITPTTSTINGVSSIALTTGQSVWIFSDGTNYQIFQGLTNASNITSGSLALARIASINADTYLGNNTGGGSVPLQVSFPSCSGASNALTYNTTTHGMGCNNIVAGTVISNAIGGLVLSNDGTTPTTVLDIAAGVAADSTNATYISLNSAFTKKTGGAWASGTAQNGMGNGLTIANNSWYDVCLANNGGTPDIWFDTSNRSTTYSQCANRPSGISDTKFRRLGSFLTNGSAQIIAFVQNLDMFTWAVATQDYTMSNPGTTATVVQLTVPTGIVVEANFIFDTINGSNNHFSLVTPTSIPDAVPSGTNFTFNTASSASSFHSGGQMRMPTSTIGQVRFRISASGASDVVTINTIGWRDYRGQ